ncbi:unnamed protein product [Hydatigera taeniaeformis]|uniref:Uncharacterized protein n=1 Tax=Hydatigena taeniaeformis TaxID=6205 RepID=A0A0R3X3M8_HYDTA|nr:unnamed protein product [Hydatigera taeniaeformis]
MMLDASKASAMADVSRISGCNLELLLYIRNLITVRAPHSPSASPSNSTTSRLPPLKPVTATPEEAPSGVEEVEQHSPLVGPIPDEERF